jgi:hypothetical protein
VFGGKGSNHTKDRIIKESSLSEIYKNIRVNYEEVYCLDPTVPTHQPPDMRKTFEKLAKHMHREHTNDYIPGRHENVPSIPNALSDGASKCAKGTKEDNEADDEEAEVEEGGDLSALD